MGWLLRFSLAIWPFAEIAVFIAVAAHIGWLAAIALMIVGAACGAALLRANGLAMALNAQGAMARGEMPLAALFDGACVAVAALLLIVPGFIGDAVAVLLLFKPVRMGLRRWLAGHFTPMAEAPAADPGVIDGEWRVVSEDDPQGAPPPAGSAGCAPGTSVIATERPDPRSER